MRTMKTPKIGAAIKARREKMKMSQADLSRATDIGPSYLCRLERGDFLPRIPTLQKIAFALKTTAVDLMGDV